MQIRKSQLRKVIQEQVGAFFVCPQPIGTVGRTKNLESSLNNEYNETDINKDALKDVIRQVVADVEKSSHNRMVGEVSGVDSLKPNDPHTPEDEAEKDAADDVMEADPKKDGGRPRGAPRIDNERFWDLPEKSLRYIIKDASEAIAANPMSRKASGKWADEVNDAVTVLHFRRKKGIKVDEAKEVGSLASNPQSKALIKKMHALVTKQLKLKSIEDIQPLKDGVGFIFGDKKEAGVLANYLKKAGVLGKSIPLAAGDGDRTLVSLKLK